MSDKKPDPLDELDSMFDELHDEAEAELKRAEEQLRSLRERPKATGAPPTKPKARASASYNIGPDGGGDPDAESGGPEPEDENEPEPGDDRGVVGRFMDWMQGKPDSRVICATTICSKTPPESTDPQPRASRGVNRAGTIFMASYEIGRAAALAAMGGNGAAILAEGARKLALIDRPELKSAAAELSAIAGNWNASKQLVSGFFHGRIEKADDQGPLYHAAGCAYLLGTMREYCQWEVADFTPGQIADEINKAKAHAGVLCDLEFSNLPRGMVEMKFGGVVDPIRSHDTKGPFEKHLKNHVQFIDGLKGVFGSSLR